MAVPTCQSLNGDCGAMDISVAVGLSDPVIRGDSARVIARYSNYDGSPAHRLRTTVEILTLRQFDGVWKVQNRKVKAIG